MVPWSDTFSIPAVVIYFVHHAQIKIQPNAIIAYYCNQPVMLLFAEEAIDELMDSS